MLKNLFVAAAICLASAAYAQKAATYVVSTTDGDYSLTSTKTFFRELVYGPCCTSTDYLQFGEDYIQVHQVYEDRESPTGTWVADYKILLADISAGMILEVEAAESDNFKTPYFHFSIYPTADKTFMPTTTPASFAPEEGEGMLELRFESQEEAEATRNQLLKLLGK